MYLQRTLYLSAYNADNSRALLRKRALYFLKRAKLCLFSFSSCHVLSFKDEKVERCSSCFNVFFSNKANEVPMFFFAKKTYIVPTCVLFYEKKRIYICSGRTHTLPRTHFKRHTLYDTHSLQHSHFTAHMLYST